MGQLFSIGAGGLVPITNDGLSVGLKVIQGNHGDTGVVIELRADGAYVIYEDGKSHFGQRLESRSPYTRITPVEPREIVGPVEIARLKELAEATRLQNRRDRDEAQRLHHEDVKRFTAEFEAEYLQRLIAGSSHARGAKNLKKLLQAAFPGVQFKVSSKSYSGGDSIDASWTDGPTTKDVEAISGKFSEGSFNGMEDMYESTDVPEREAFNAVMGSAKYVFAHRSYNNLTRDAVAGLVKDSYGIPAEASYYSTMIPQLNQYLDRYVNGLLSETSIPTGGYLTGLSYETGDCVLLFTVPALRASGQLQNIKQAGD